jgi:hypothetical protein
MAAKENNLIKKILIDRSKLGAVLFRNNTGVGFAGNPPRKIRYGLAKGSSDLIGWTVRIITPEEVGKKVAIFTAIEVKTGRLKPTPEQENFLRVVRESGGIAEVIYEREN